MNHNSATGDFLTLFDGICDKTKELQTLRRSMSNDFKTIILSSGRYMFARFTIEQFIGGVFNPFEEASKGFSAKIHYGNEILNQNL